MRHKMLRNEIFKLSDRDLIYLRKLSTNRMEKNWAGEALFKRYEKQIHKNWLRLCAQMNNTPLIKSLQEDYYDEANEAFLLAIEKTDLNKIKNNDWKFVGMLNWYLANVRKKMIKQALKQGVVKSLNHMHAIAEDDSSECDPDVEISYWDSEGYKTEPSFVIEFQDESKKCIEVLEKCKKKWLRNNGLEIEILDRLQDKQTRNEIAGELGLTTSKVYNIIKSMKRDIQNAFN